MTPRDLDRGVVRARLRLIEHDLANTLQPSVGLRNELAHEYVDIDLQVVVLATTSATREYRAYLRSASA